MLPNSEIETLLHEFKISGNEDAKLKTMSMNERSCLYTLLNCYLSKNKGKKVEKLKPYERKYSLLEDLHHIHKKLSEDRHLNCEAKNLKLEGSYSWIERNFESISSQF